MPILANILICVFAVTMSTIVDLAVLIKVQVILNIIFLIRKSGKYVSAGLVFFILICLFHYGRLIVSTPDSFESISDDLLCQSIKFAIISISAISLGYFVSVKGRMAEMTNINVELSSVDLNKLRKISVWIITLTIIPLVYIDLIKIQYTLINGYVGINTLGEQNMFVKYMSSFTTLTRPAVLLLMLSYYHQPKKARLVLITFCVYSLITMFSGSRATPMIYIVSIIVLYVKLYVKRFNLYSLILLTTIIVLVFYILPVITVLRQGAFDIGDVVATPSEIENDGGRMTAVASEFGGTLVSLIYAIQFTSSFNYGLTYLLGFITISPKIPQSLLPLMSTQLTFTNSFPANFQYTLGGSCLGEAYFNFGWFAPIFCVFIGFLVAKLDKDLVVIKKENLIRSIILVTAMPYIFLWVRGFFCTMIFAVFWVSIIYRYFIKKVA